MKFRGFRSWLAVALVLASLSGSAADIDLFAAVPASGGELPHLLFMLDNSANFSAQASGLRCSITTAGVVDTSGGGADATRLDKTAGALEQCALYSALSALNTEAGAPVRIGFMGFNASGLKQFNPSSNSFSTTCINGSGACLLMPFVPFNSENKAKILAWIRKWDIAGEGDYVIKSSNIASGAAMQEAWAYYFGKTGVSGRSYSEMAPTVGCASRNIVFLGNAYLNTATAGDGTSEASSPWKRINGLSLDLSQRASPAATAVQKEVITASIQTSCSVSSTALASLEGKGVYALNWARYLKAQGVTTFSLAVLGPQCSPDYAAHLAKLGSPEVGGGGFFPANDFAQLTAAIGTTLSTVQSVSSAFSSVSLPLSGAVQGVYLNQVYIGMFRPQIGFLPRWSGNLKQYQLGQAGGSGQLRLEDADSAPAIDSLTGFIGACARSYWTPLLTDNYWGLDPGGACKLADGHVKTAASPPGDASAFEMKASNTPDGPVVAKGAQAYLLRAMKPADRNVFTCSATMSKCTVLTNFNTANKSVTQTMLNSGGTDRDSLINWARGTNIADELEKTTSVMRPSVHGDVVHSRPVAVNHGTLDAPSVVVYYGGNDGLLRAVNGNRGRADDSAVGQISSGGSAYAAGAEIWSFMAPEFYGKIKRLRDNMTAISYPVTASSVSPGLPKDYGFDGPVSAFQGAVDGVNKTYVYASMRRGGRVIYAFDVTVPGSPVLLWKKGCPTLSKDTSCTKDASGDFSGIGQTWSALKTFFAAGYESGMTPLLITGGGYDNCEDHDDGVSGGRNHKCVAGVGSGSAKGHKVYLLNAVTGAIVRAFDTDRSVVADSTLVPDGTSGKTRYAYTADLGGGVYRISFTGASAADWTLRKIASLGCNSPTACGDSVPNRKFMFAPSVVSTDGLTYHLLLGSGDREKPVKQYVAAGSVSNYFFMLKDKPEDRGWLTSESANCGAESLCMASLLGIATGASPTDADLGRKKGWYLGLDPTEQVVTSAITLFGASTFSTHQPPTALNTCTGGLGSTRVYKLGYLNAASQNATGLPYEDLVGGGLPASPVAGLVILDSGKTAAFCIGCSGNSALDGSLAGAPSALSRPLQKLYWYIRK